MRITDPDRVFDGLLVQQYISGDVKALDLLIKRWNKRVCAYAYRETKDKELARDIGQEVWMVAIKKLNRLQDHTKIGAWLLSITHNKCIDAARSEQREKNALRYYDHPKRTKTKTESTNNEKIRLELRKLPDNQQAVLRLFYLEGMNINETSEILQIPKGTVKSRLFHAREKLKNIFKKNYD